jgi:hypothetical protein
MSTHPESAAVALIKAAIWPFVVLVSLALFYSPVHRTLDSLAQRSDSIQTIKLGNLELDIKASDLPSPNSATANALRLVDQSMILELLPIDVKYGTPKCYFSLTEDQQYITDEKLSKLRLIDFKQEDPGKGPPCDNLHRAKFTPLGLEVRDFLLKVIAIEISGKNSNSDIK